MKLIIGDKNLSSWSLRPWLAMKAFGIPFEEIKIFLDRPNTTAEILKYSPSARVPCLIDGDLVIPESLAILEYLAEKYPTKKMWPEEMKTRAQARAVSHEMHGGFLALRTTCPHKVKERYPNFDYSKAKNDVTRIEQIWAECLKKSKDSGLDKLGPYLFGAFSIADAMYAPVVNRFRAYHIQVSPLSRQYMEVILKHPEMQEWEKDALEEVGGA